MLNVKYIVLYTLTQQYDFHFNFVRIYEIDNKYEIPNIGSIESSITSVTEP